MDVEAVEAVGAAFAAGRIREALERYEALAAGQEAIPAGLAWRYGSALYLWGDPQTALEVLRRAEPGDTADTALVLSWTASACWLTGDVEACQESAERAGAVAAACGDPRALATAGVALALRAYLTGEPAAMRAHYLQAMATADAAGDMALAARVRVNLAAGLDREARYHEALDLLTTAVAFAERAGHLLILALALCNQAALLHRLGRLDEALAGYRRAADTYQRCECRKIAYALNGLGDVHRLRGEYGLARAAYQEAVREAEADRNRQALVPGLAGLARVLATEDPEQAAALAERAVAAGSGPQMGVALLAAAAVHLARGAGDQALASLRAAGETARRQRDHSALAETLELRAAVASQPAEARGLLHEARTIWLRADATIEADRVLVALAGLPGAAARDRAEARLAAGRLAAVGVPPPGPGAAAVRLQVLARFVVRIGGTEVPSAVWQSRKARDLLRILVARRGRTVPREEVVGLLWGEEDTEGPRAGHRLRVTLSVARGVLDPGRLLPADHYIAGDQSGLALRLDRLSVDVEDFLADAAHVLHAAESGAGPGSWRELMAVEQRYTGDVFADDPYDDWARPLREEARTVHLRLLRAVVRGARADGDPDTALQYLSRVLAVDPHDEHAHRTIVGTLRQLGRHGEARRAHDHYLRAMAEIGITPASPAAWPPPTADGRPRTGQ